MPWGSVGGGCCGGLGMTFSGGATGGFEALLQNLYRLRGESDNGSKPG